VTPLEYARRRLSAFLSEIARLKEVEIPYPHSKASLDRLESVFQGQLQWLRSLDTTNDPAVVNEACKQALRALFYYLPLLGFILRSTNIRNAFEVYGPLLQLASNLLEPKSERKIHLLLSSEWDYSPFIYSFPDLPGFVLIGLPATESSNPLLMPLAGHELGHSIWARQQLGKRLASKIEQAVRDRIRGRWSDYQQAYPEIEVKPDELETNLLALVTYEKSVEWAGIQAEESFCDFIGLRIFGRSYLHAFAYLLSPGLPGQRSPHYPNMPRRIENILAASDTYGVQVPEEYNGQFVSQDEPDYSQGDAFQLSIAVEALQKIIPELISTAAQIVHAARVTSTSDDEVNRIYRDFLMMIPSKHTRCLADILNAGWKVFEEPDRWMDIGEDSDRKDFILKELVLKTIEVFEYEQIIAASSE
jgi:hypothetical protein